MEANINGFHSAVHPCEFGSCDPVSQCKSSMADLGAMEFGPTPEYTINSSQPYKVRTQFFADQDENGDATALTNVMITLSQGEVFVELNLDCPDYINSLTWKLYYNMNIGVSVY